MLCCMSMFPSAGFPELFRQAVPLVGAQIKRKHEGTNPAVLPKRDEPAGGQQGGTIIRHGAIEQAAEKNIAFKTPYYIFVKSELNEPFAKV